jgi:hypothetical protein
MSFACARVVDELTRHVHPPKKKKTEKECRCHPPSHIQNPKIALQIDQPVVSALMLVMSGVPSKILSQVLDGPAGRVIRWRGPGVLDLGKRIGGLVRRHGGEEKQADRQS